MKTISFVTALALTWAVLAGGGQPYLGVDAGDVVVVTVKKVSSHKASNGDPPRLELDVHEVLRGERKADRSHAVWVAAPHHHDTGGDEQLRKARARWAAKPLVAPKVGDKFVLWGALTSENKRAEFRAYSYHAYLYSPQKRAWALRAIKEGELRAKCAAARAEADKKALARARADWRAKVSAADLGRYVAQADIVAVGRVTSEGGATEFRVAKLLKGRKRKEHEGNYFSVVLPREVRPLLDREVDYLLFLTFTQRPVGTVSSYARISTGDGIVLADKAALEAVSKALGRK